MGSASVVFFRAEKETHDYIKTGVFTLEKSKGFDKKIESFFCMGAEIRH